MNVSRADLRRLREYALYQLHHETRVETILTVAGMTGRPAATMRLVTPPISQHTISREQVRKALDRMRKRAADN